MASEKASIVEQDGNFFRKNAGGGYDPLPRTVEQNGNHFDLDPSSGEYKVSVATSARPSSFAEDPLGAAKDVGVQVGKKALEGLAWAGEKIDRVTGAPTRSAILAGMKGENPLSAYVKQFGRNTETAPTGKDIATLGGVSDKQSIKLPTVSKYLGKVSPELGKYFESISPAGAVGLGVDLIADPTNFIAPEKLIGKAASATGKGLEEAVKTGSKIAAGASDLITGTKLGTKTLSNLQKGADIIKSSAKGAAEGIEQFAKSKIADDFKELEAIAVKNGIPVDRLPEEIKYGQSDAITRISKKIREGVAGGDELKNFYDTGKMVGEKIDDKIKSFSGGQIPRNTAEAGEILLDGYNKGVKEFFDNIDVTYKTPSKLLENTVNGQKVKLQLSRNASRDLTKKIATFEESQLYRAGKALDPNARAMAKRNAEIAGIVMQRIGTFDEAVDAMRELGQVAFSAGSHASDAVSYDKKALRQLYFDMSDEIVNTVRRTAGKRMANDLLANNKKIHEFLKEKALIADVMENSKISPEKLFNRLVQNGETKKVKVLVSLLPDENLNQIRGAFLENLISRKVDDSIPLAQLKKSLSKKDPIASILFKPNELQDINELVTLGERFGNAVLSTSGTGASVNFENIPKGIIQGTMERAVRETLKDSAANAANATAAPIAKAAAPATLFRKFSRGPRETVLKASQVLSTKDKNENKNESAIDRRLRGRR